MAKRRSVIIVVILGIIAVTIGVFVLARGSDSEPSYAGKSLREWLEQSLESASRRALRGEDDDPKAVASIRSIGTNAIPFLLRWLQHYKPVPPWRENVYDGVVKIAGDRAVWPWAKALESDTLNGILASEGFRILGPQAKGAIPELTRLMSDSSRPDVIFRATRAIAHIGEEAVPSLLAMATNRDLATQTTALNGLQMMGTNAHSAVPTVLTLLSNNHANVRVAASNCLRKIAPSL